MEDRSFFGGRFLWESLMNDLLMLGTAALLVTLSWLLVVLCDRLTGGKP
jgi:hypothetical protein